MWIDSGVENENSYTFFGTRSAAVSGKSLVPYIDGSRLA